MGEKDPYRKGPFGWEEVALLAVLVLLGRVPSLFFYHSDWDEAALMAESWAMTRGQVLYKDIVQIHPPLNFAILVPFFHIFRPEWVPFAIKTMNLLLVFLGALLVAKIAFEWLTSRSLGFVGGSIFIFYCSRWWALAPYGEFYTIFPILLSVWLLYFAKNRRMPAYYLIGFLWGVACFFKQIAIFDAIGLYLGYLWLARTSKGFKTTATGLLALGFASVAALISIYFLHQGALSEAWTSIFVRSMFYASPSGEMWSSVSWLIRGTVRHLGLSLLAFPAGAYLLFSRRNQPGADKPSDTFFFLILLTWFCTDLVGLCALGRFYPHYLLQLAPAASLLPLFILNRTVGRVRKAMWMSFVLAITSFLCINFLAGMWRLAEANWVPAQIKQSTAVSDFIKRHTREDDRIFLYKTDNLDIFFLSQRLSNNGVYMFDAMVADHMHDRAEQERKRREFLARLPEIIVVGSNDAKSPDISEQFQTPDHFFEDILKKYYTVGETVSDLDLFVLRR